MRFGLSRPVLASLAAALLFGASTPLAKALLSSISPLTLAALLYLGGAIGALPFAFRGGSAEIRRDPRPPHRHGRSARPAGRNRTRRARGNGRLEVGGAGGRSVHVLGSRQQSH